MSLHPDFCGPPTMGELDEALTVEELHAAMFDYARQLTLSESPDERPPKDYEVPEATPEQRKAWWARHTPAPEPSPEAEQILGQLPGYCIAILRFGHPFALNLPDLAKLQFEFFELLEDGADSLNDLGVQVYRAVLRHDARKARLEREIEGALDEYHKPMYYTQHPLSRAFAELLGFSPEEHDILRTLLADRGVTVHLRTRPEQRAGKRLARRKLIELVTDGRRIGAETTIRTIGNCLPFAAIFREEDKIAARVLAEHGRRG